MVVLGSFSVIARSLQRLANAEIFLIILIFLQFFFLLNGTHIFGEGWNPAWNYTILVYMAASGVFLATSQYSLTRLPLEQSIMFLVLGFFGMLSVVMVMREQGMIVADPIHGSLIIPTIIYQTVVVATSEEILFRGVVNDTLKKAVGPVLGILAGSLIFALFHLSAYSSFGVGPFLMAFMFGILFSFTKEAFGLPMAIGMHAAWNIAVSGALYVFTG